MKVYSWGRSCLLAMGGAHAGLGHDDHEEFATTITKITMFQNEATKFTESNVHRVHRAPRGLISAPRVLRGHAFGPH